VQTERKLRVRESNRYPHALLPVVVLFGVVLFGVWLSAAGVAVELMGDGWAGSARTRARSLAVVPVAVAVLWECWIARLGAVVGFVLGFVRESESGFVFVRVFDSANGLGSRQESDLEPE